jgi:hypothetical protein
MRDKKLEKLHNHIQESLAKIEGYQLQINNIVTDLYSSVDNFNTDIVFEKTFDDLDIIDLHNIRDISYYKQLFLTWISEITGYTEDQIIGAIRSKRGSQYLRFVRKFWFMSVIDIGKLSCMDFVAMFPGYSREVYYDSKTLYEKVLDMPNSYPIHLDLIKKFNERWKQYSQSREAQDSC